MTIYKVNSKVYKKHKARFIKVSKNQFRIMESLFIDGSKDKRYYDNEEKLKYSEHSGLLDFGKTKLEKVIVNATPNKSDKLDDIILLPDNMEEEYDFEYIFHTHPSTPEIGSRINEGVLYEFPSISDLYHFAEHYNNGHIQGSIIIAPEGIYIIKCIDPKKKITIKGSMEDDLEAEYFNIQDSALEKYASNFNKNRFHKVMAKDFKFINLYNSLIKGLNLKIFYKPREYINKKWILNDLYLKIRPIEIE